MGMRKIYRQIARENGVTVKEVRDKIQEAVSVAYQNPPKDEGVTPAFQERIPRRGEIPTSEEIIRFAAGEIQKKRVKQ